ncbi:hypothetical protein F0L74_11755 [Chitinophaga agrisoli]|uniref:Tox-PL domain-containing protein n=1 Tax=Chitinophaga agrisoli TaxID=2607653 RepID=A0A5B2VTR6_9BACT|nr:RHS repeat-associated core domain-containing protein [Chitinophaga agrisoli]KAA2243183.1 hypothetical protein F0L74_11755 [Chitinophaga agrisoli]
MLTGFPNLKDMMHYLHKQKKIGQYIVLFVLLAFTNSAWAQTGSSIFKKVLDGGKGQLVKDAAITIQDTAYFSATLQNKLDTPYKVTNIVTFKINEYAPVYLPAQFTATARIRVIYTTRDHTIDSVTEKVLEINYDTAKAYAVRSSFVFRDAHEVTVKVLDITTSISGVIPALVLENELQAQPAYKLSCIDDAVHKITLDVAANTDSTDELRVTWDNAIGADEYDLEWAYIDSSALKKYGTHPNAALIFDNNASRVTVKDNAYAIPLLYDNGGILYMRVRAIIDNGNNQRIETIWSSDFPDGLGSYIFTGHQRRLNWQSDVSYAEDGKRKAVVQYFDGSLRSRQMVTKDNTTGTTVVGESYYDYQGRPVIQVLPAPTINTIIKYSRNFNTAVNGGEYDKDGYDHMLDSTEFLTASAAEMSADSGASRYYSPNNPERDNGINRFIPDAQGYPFTETSYTQDNTGRISRQGGVGPVYKLGSNHETKYYYGSPGDNDLDALFGTEAGDKTHYFKNMVRDANGQYSISYVDMHGRTIATALAGLPDSASLDALPSYSVYSTMDVLSKPGSNVVKEMVMESRQSQVVAIPSDYEFSYSLTPPVLQKQSCAPDGSIICYPALYDLEITITDDSYNLVLDGKPVRKVVYNYKRGNIQLGACNDALPSFDTTFVVNLKKGNYEITKRLTISQEGLDYYRDSIFLPSNLCRTLDDFIQQQRLLVANMQCVPTCQSCLDGLGTLDEFRSRYINALGDGDIPSDSRIQLAYREAQENCDALCNKVTEAEDLRKAMLMDVTPPSGQYANIDNELDTWSVFYTSGTDTLPPYQRPYLLYKDELGNPDHVHDDITNAEIAPQNLEKDRFSANFKSSWAETLLPLHPEYCKLLEMEKHNSSYNWDKLFGAVDTYAEAKEKGYLNPTANTLIAPFTAYHAVPENEDSLALESADLQAKLEEKLSNYQQNGYSIWSLAVIAIKCKQSETACASQYSIAGTAFDETSLCEGELDMAWRTFREMYLQAKRDIINGLIQQSCPGPKASDLTAAGKQPHFNNTIELLNQQGIGYMNNSDGTAAQNAANVALQQSYDSTCAAYAEYWLQQVAPCQYNSDAWRDIKAKLIQVCKEGSDIDHPYGSSTVKPGSTNEYKSFADVLNEYNSQHSANPLVCNGEMITAPKPYDKQSAFVNKTLYGKPADCECTKLTKLNGEYRANATAADTSFAAYLFRTRRITMSDDELNQLMTACNGNSTCGYFPQPITIPPALQCYTGDICVTCQTVDSLYNLFSTTYPGNLPAIEETDETQAKKNTLFANFMNNRLGFNKQAWEYLDFRKQCEQQSNPTFARVLSSQAAQIGTTCDQLQTLKQQFLQLYPASMGDTVTVNRNIPVVDVLHLRVFEDDSTEQPAFRSQAALAAVVWTDTRWYRLRDNITFSFAKLAKDAVITNASLTLTGKPDDIDFYLGYGSEYKAIGYDNTYGVFERALGPVIENVTTWSSQPATTAANRLALPPLQEGYRTNSYPDQPCTGLAKDLYMDYLRGNYNGLIFRLNEDSLNNVYRGMTLWSNGAAAPSNVAPVLKVIYKASRCEEFVAYMNEQLPHSAFTPQSLEALYMSVCGAGAGICSPADTYPTYNGPLLCDKATPLFGPVTESINNCSDNEFFAISTGTELYKAYKDSIRNSFDSAYINTALQAATLEDFKVKYNASEYHYTLYYYDQAGNLIKTIPPAGVVVNRTQPWLDAVKNARAAGQSKVPEHTMATEYHYNTLNLVIAQQTPDAGQSRFWYDRLGRLAVSQNARQAPLKAYSYTLYDPLGRIIEVGEISSGETMSDDISRNDNALTSWIAHAENTKAQITRTTYDKPYTPLEGAEEGHILLAANVRNRVSWSAVYNTKTDLDSNKYAAGTFYSYDIHGNVDTLVQDFRKSPLQAAGNRWRKMVYRYDLISGKVNEVAYQPGEPDAFYHRYSYDAENRLTNVETSHDSIYWENDAFYQYYKHGPLARAVLGQQQVQGLDYAYTLQGWLKGVNSTALTPGFDMSGDGASGSIVAKDAFGFALHYFGNRDYNPIKSSVKPFAEGVDAGSNFRPLFNGNIAAMSVHLPTLGEPMLYAYNYDVLNRLTAMNALRNLNKTTNTWMPSLLEDFKERVTYDANGNILSYLRNGNQTFAGKPLGMDSLSYAYISDRNQLDHIEDKVDSMAYDNDIDSQLGGNYAYDSIGNLIRDTKEGIDSIKWTVYGKIQSIHKSNGTNIYYTYDVTGNRISKNVNGKQTWYVRDASGNIMSVYTVGDATVNNGDLTQTETNLYGSSRLGMSTLYTNIQHTVLPVTTNMPGLGTGINITFTRGNKIFELSNHLGNVLVTVLDVKKGVSVDGSTVDHYEAKIASAQDYYPFGMLMPGRNGHKIAGGWSSGNSVVNGYSVPESLTVNNRSGNQPGEYVAAERISFTEGFNSGGDDRFDARIADGGYVSESGGVGGGNSEALSGYRYGFNGKENDGEVKGEGNEQDYGMRVYDPRVGRFLSVDPITAKYPELTPYQFASNRPIDAIDLDGLEALPVAEGEAAPVMRPIIGGLRTPMPMAPYTRYGVSPAGAAYEENPLSTIEQIKQAEEHRREEYLLNNVLIGGKWVPRFEDEVRDLRAKRTQAALEQFDENRTGGIFVNSRGRMLRGRGRGYNINRFGGESNCAGCTIAGDATLNGRPAIALNHEPMTAEDFFMWFSPLKVPTRHEKLKEIETLMKQAGDGATGVIFGHRANIDGLPVDGHFFNVVNEKGKIKFLDFQQKPNKQVIDTKNLMQREGYDALFFRTTNR